MNKLVVVMLLIVLFVLIGLPSSKIQNIHFQTEDSSSGDTLTLPIQSIANAFGLDYCIDDVIANQVKKRNYRKIIKGIKSYARNLNRYTNEKLDTTNIAELLSLDNLSGLNPKQCLLPLSFPSSHLVTLAKKELSLVTLGNENLYCKHNTNSSAGSFIEPTDFYPYQENITTYLSTINISQQNIKIKKIKKKLNDSETESRSYKILQSKLRSAILERSKLWLFKKQAQTHLNIYQEICGLENSHKLYLPKAAKIINQLDFPPRLDEQEIESQTSRSLNIDNEFTELDPRAEVATSGFTINTSNRKAVANAYKKYYLASQLKNLNEVGWTGNVESCKKGTVSQKFLNDSLRRVNYYRAQAGLPSDIKYNSTKNRKAQEAALVMARQRGLSHSPATDFPGNPCLTAGAQEAAQRSNLSLGAFGAAAIDGFMIDSGSNNGAVGHRRWILYPRAREMGHGSIPNTSKHFGASSLWVIGDFKSSAPKKAVAWPNAGYVPYQVAPLGNRSFPRWSFTYPGADFRSASIEMFHRNETVKYKKEILANGFGDNSIVWRPIGLPTGIPRADKTYRIIISGVKNAPKSTYAYNVTLINPDTIADPPVDEDPPINDNETPKSDINLNVKMKKTGKLIINVSSNPTVTSGKSCKVRIRFASKRNQLSSSSIFTDVITPGASFKLRAKHRKRISKRKRGYVRAQLICDQRLISNSAIKKFNPSKIRSKRKIPIKKWLRTVHKKLRLV